MKLVVLLISCLSVSALATTTEELERKINILADEINQLKASQQQIGQNQTFFGLGQAASKVYFLSKGLSIGGYGEIVYKNQASKNQDNEDTNREPTTEALRNVIYLGYKYSNKWVLNTEIEIEHVNEVFTEFMYLDYLHSDHINFRYGLSLIPMGLVNELHEPIYFNSVNRPEVEQYLLPSTWREVGIGVFGAMDKFQYKAFIFNGPDADAIAANISQGIRKGRKKGGVGTNASTGALVVRADYSFNTASSIGGSLFGGKASSSNTGDNNVDMEMRIGELHATYKYKNFGVKFLTAKINFTNSEDWNEKATNNIPEAMSGSYLEFEYDLGLAKGAVLTPFYRLEQYDLNQTVDSDSYGTKDKSLARTNHVVGLAYKPLPKIVFKLDHTRKLNDNDSAISETNLGLGFIY